VVLQDLQLFHITGFAHDALGLQEVGGRVQPDYEGLDEPGEPVLTFLILVQFVAVHLVVDDGCIGEVHLFGDEQSRGFVLCISHEFCLGFDGCIST
jgi:hypothetical protein